MKKNDRTQRFAPLLIFLAVVGFIGFLAWSAFQAGELGTRVTDAAYYSKGLKYNATQVEKHAAEVLGWNLEVEMEAHALEFLLTDEQGAGVTGASGLLYLAVPGAAENIQLELEETGAGRYRARLNAGMKGSIQARLEIERQGARLNRQLLLNL